MSNKTAVIRARCSDDFKQSVLNFLRANYPEEDEAWVVRTALKEFMVRQAPALLRDSPAPHHLSRPLMDVSYSDKSGGMMSPAAQAVVLAAQNELRVSGAIAPPPAAPPSVPANPSSGDPVHPPKSRARALKARKKSKTKFST